MIRVAYLCEFPSVNGGENSLLSFLQSAQSHVQPVFLCPGSGLLAERLNAAGIERHVFCLTGDSGQRKSAQQISSELLQLIARIDVDLVHANSLSMSRILGRIASGLSCPTIGHIRDILKVSGKVVSDLGNLDLCLCVSDATRNCYLEQGLSKAKVVTLYNGISLPSLRGQLNPGSKEVREHLGIPLTSLVIGGVGQIGLRKGWDVLLDAVERLVVRHHESLDIHVVLAGVRHSQKKESIEFESKLRNRANVGRLKGRVHLVGYWSPIYQFLQEIDFLAHPAHQEPLGRVLLEAAVSSVPVVATDVGGTREIFGEHGAVLVPDGDVNSMAAALLDLIQNQTAASERAASTQEFVKRRFAVDVHQQQLLQHYGLLCAGKDNV